MSNVKNDELYQQVTDICFDNGGVTKPMVEKLLQLISDHDAQLYEELMAGEELVIDHGSNFNDMKQLWAVPLDHIKTIMKGEK